MEVRAVPGPVERLQFTFESRGLLELFGSGLEIFHSYLWPRITVTLADGTTLNHDFKTNGLDF